MHSNDFEQVQFQKLFNLIIQSRDTDDCIRECKPKLKETMTGGERIQKQRDNLTVEEKMVILDQDKE